MGVRRQWAARFEDTIAFSELRGNVRCGEVRRSFCDPGLLDRKS